MNTTYFFSKTMSLTVNSSLQLYGTQIGHNGVYIKSTVDVSVYISTLCALSEDTYVCLPVKSLERAYYVSSNRFETTGKDFVSLFMVISPFANTEVNISFPNGTSISKTLNWLDVYQETNLNDLTGTIVLASKPVSVVSGHACVLIIDGGNNCDMIGEQMIPTNAFQTHFIVPPILSNKFIVRIFSSKSNNTVCMKNESFENCTMLGANQLFESAPQHLPLVVTSQEPISVIQYKGTQSYMTTIPGVRQFMNSYTFVRPLVYQNKNDYISVTILSSASQTLRLDGKLPSDQLVDTAHVVPPFNNYTVLTFRITAGYHVMSSTERNVVFGLIVFGFDDLSAYGFPAGMNFGKYV
ncbi:hypothetical protein DPMN_119935 [Dreissena polymorpha]|uniref:IgGFc-binding protein N-terminal domain-containing protein n=1 Tax=Dreissena polymorpha TaxID=45954 RepID=A0A9D4JN72_DREPO|nr:hypothetical protein DPMN_119935 [Dreissena polymorpha]